MRKPYVIGGIVAAVLALIVLVVVLVNRDGSPNKWIAKKYSRVAANTYGSPKAPNRVSAEIAKKFKPIDNYNALGTGAGIIGAATAGGIFLQYPQTVVGVLPNGTGSRITVDTASGGYNRYHSYVGGRWHSPGTGGWTSSGIASFRGGGPGSGK